MTDTHAREIQARLAAIAPTLQGVVDQGLLSGAVTLVWRGGEILDVTAVGRRDLSTGAPMKRDTLFRIASMTKPMTSVLALQMIEEGAIRLDEPITVHAPEFSEMRVLDDPAGSLEKTSPAPRDITFEDLLTHRSGISYDFTSEGVLAKAYRSALGGPMDVRLSPDAWMEALGNLPLAYAPGQRFHYGHSTDVLGFILARVAGKPFRSLMMERLIEPLGMTDTDFWIPPSKRDRAAVVYRFEEEASGLKPLLFRDLEGPPDYCSGGGGLVSTADDYLRFAAALISGGVLDGVRILKPESVGLLTRNRLTDAQREIPFFGLPYWAGQGFGLGVSVILDVEKQAWLGAGSDGAYGWPGAFGTWWRADPKERLVLLYLVQNAMPLEPGSASQLATGQRLAAAAALPMVQNIVYEALRGGGF